MLRPHGYITVVGGWQDQVESDSIVCSHCNVIVLVKPGTAATVYVYPQMEGPPQEAEGAFCRQCMKPICLRCLARGICTPLMRRIEDMEARGRAWQEAGLL